LHLKNGSWESDEPWFAIDLDDEEKAYAFIPADTFSQMVEAMKTAQQENFNLKLEKTIWQNVPIDFQDVWIVAMDEIKKELAKSKDKKSFGIDIDKIVKDIKKKYPNLFLNLDKYLSQTNQEDII